MENKITVPQLSAMIAIATGKQKKLCEDFLREVCRIVSDELEKGENVRIKGFGTFKLVEVDPRKSVNVTNGEEYEIPGHRKVIFVAAKELASAVNSPFEAFEAVEISDDVSTELLLEEDEDTTEPVESVEEPPVITPHYNVYGGDETVSETNSEESVLAHTDISDPNVTEKSTAGAGTEVIEEPKDSLVHKQEDITEKVTIKDSDCDNINDSGEDVSDDDVLPVYDDEKSGKGKFGWGFLCGFLTAAAVCAVVWWIWGRDYVEKDVMIAEEDLNVELTVSDVADEDSIGEDTVSSLAVLQDSVAGASDDSVPTQPSDQPVYDTISTTRFLTTMAKEHYGNFNLWPIIYEENKAILGHPDRIRPGTRVIVPPLKKYGVDASNEEDIKRIKQKGLDIYSRYK